MHSPTLDIPMRFEVPLRALIKGGPHLKGSYAVYLHTLLTNTGAAFVYYGITKRNVNVRFDEHSKAALEDNSTRLFPSKLNKLTQARVDFVYKKEKQSEMLDGIITTVCAIGLDEDAAMDTEEYLVDKYSLASKHSSGLNMIPGGSHESPHFCATLKSPSLGFPRTAGWRIIREGELCARRRNDLISFMSS